MKRLIHSVFTTGLLALSGMAVAAETGNVVQAFTCNFKAGTTTDDFWRVADTFREAMADIKGPGLETINVVALLPFRASAPADLMWLVASPNLNALGQGLTTYYGSAAGNAADAAFNEIADCDAGIAFYETVAAGDLGDADATDREADGSFEMFGCNVQPGKTMADVQNAVSFFKQQLGKIDSDALDKYAAWMWTPYRASGQFDFAFVGAYPDLVTHMKADSDYLTSAAGQAADERFASVSKCSSGLWSGYGIFERNAEALQ